MKKEILDIKGIESLACKLASQARPGEIYALFGDLGAGKTTFASFFAKFLGLDSEVTSPTFVIAKEYKLNHPKIKELVHIDCYRLNSIGDLDTDYLTELLDRPGAVVIVEWPEKIWPLIKSKAKVIKLKYINENEREIEY